MKQQSATDWKAQAFIAILVSTAMQLLHSMNSWNSYTQNIISQLTAFITWMKQAY